MKDTVEDNGAETEPGTIFWVDEGRELTSLCEPASRLFTEGGQSRCERVHEFVDGLGAGTGVDVIRRGILFLCLEVLQNDVHA